MTDGQPDVGDVLRWHHMICVVVDELKDREGRRMVRVYWLDGCTNELSDHYGYNHNWRDWEVL